MVAKTSDDFYSRLGTDILDDLSAIVLGIFAKVVWVSERFDAVAELLVSFLRLA